MSLRRIAVFASSAAVVAGLAALPATAQARGEVTVPASSGWNVGKPASAAVVDGVPTHATLPARHAKDKVGMQSFGFAGDSVYVVTGIHKNATTIPPYLMIARIRGNKVISRMELDGFRNHGSGVKIQQTDQNIWVWLLKDDKTPVRIKYVAGDRVAATSSRVHVVDPGYTIGGFAFDMPNKRVWFATGAGGGQQRLRAYSFGQVVSGLKGATPRYDVTVSNGRTKATANSLAQGMQVSGSYAYHYYGAPYGTGNAKPGDTRLTRVALDGTNAVVQGPVLTWRGGMQFREPEGLAANGTAYLGFGFVGHSKAGPRIYLGKLAAVG